MYGLPQVGILANKLLKKGLVKHGYAKVQHTPGLFQHSFRPVTCTLVVEDFVVKYVGTEHANHLIYHDGTGRRVYNREILERPTLFWN